MTRLTIIKGIAIGLVAGLVAVLVLLLAREHDRAEKFHSARQQLCISQRLDIEHLLKRSTGLGDIETRVRFDVADQSTSVLCLGVEIPVNFEDADTCWIGRGDFARCYDEPLRALLTLYRQRGF